MGQTAKVTRKNRTITVDFHNEATYDQLLDDTKAFVEFVLAFLLALGFQLLHKASCSEGGGLTRHSHYAPLPLRAGSPRRTHHLAHPVHHLQSGLHRVAPLRPALPHDATRGGP